MWDFIMTKVKAFGAALGVLVLPAAAAAAIKAFEQSFGYDVPAEWEAWIIGWATVPGGWLGAYLAPKNKTA